MAATDGAITAKVLDIGRAVTGIGSLVQVQAGDRHATFQVLDDGVAKKIARHLYSDAELLLRGLVVVDVGTEPPEEST